MKKKNHIKMRFSTLLLCCLAIMLCAAPALHAEETDPAGATKDIDGLVDGVLMVEFNETANLLTGASVTQSIYVYTGGTLNMYSGTVGWFISVSPYASMTVYGTDFEVSNGTIGPDGNWTPDPLVGRGTLTGDYGDGSSINLWVWSNIAINLKPPPTEEIQIDIKPGSDLNNINLKSKGVVPVAVLSTDDFDASTIDTDTDTVKFAGASPVRWTMEDVDDDGDEDMLFHFRTKDLELDENSTKATLTAKLIGKTTRETNEGEVVIQGTDKVCIKPQKKKK